MFTFFLEETIERYSLHILKQQCSLKQLEKALKISSRIFFSGKTDAYWMDGKNAMTKKGNTEKHSSTNFSPIRSSLEKNDAKA